VVSVVLDASALLALLNDEPGAEEVETALAESIVSAVNLSEVAAILADIGMPPREVRAILGGFDLPIAPFDDELALLAAELRPATRALGLSLGDRACLALAKSRRLAALTADRAWSRLKLGVAVRVIR
jgi:PIN domain nuclease of toxin-antitoxin system